MVAALSYLLPLVVVFLRIQASLADETTDAAGSYPRLIVAPDLKGQPKVLDVAEKQFTFTCTFEAKENDHRTKADELKWTDNYGSLVSNVPGDHAYSKTLSGKSRRMQVLILTLDENLLGSRTYWCQAMYDGNSLKKSATVHVHAIPTWKSKEQEVTGRLNEPLDINCDANPAQPGSHIDTVIMFQNNTNVPVPRYEILSPSYSRLHIKALSMAERNVAVRCTAIETHSDQGVALKADKIVRINLQFPPVFAQDHVKRYGILERSVTLPCRVIDANPRVVQFEFFADGTPLLGGDKYRIETKEDEQVAILTINNLEESDFEYKNYHCRVTSEDNEFRKEMTFTLQKALPPKAPEVTFKKSWRSRVDFEIKEVTFPVNIENPPVTHFEIRFLNFNDLKELDEAERREKLAESRPRVFNKTDSNEYRVDHLHWNTLYTFDVRAVNEAGSSDAVLYNATTLEESAPEPVVGGGASASPTIASWWFMLAAAVFVVGSQSLWTVEVWGYRWEKTD